jgi:hypothetical protein
MTDPVRHERFQGDDSDFEFEPQPDPTPTEGA